MFLEGNESFVRYVRTLFSLKNKIPNPLPMKWPKTHIDNPVPERVDREKCFTKEPFTEGLHHETIRMTKTCMELNKKNSILCNHIVWPSIRTFVYVFALKSIVTVQAHHR